MYNQAKSRRKIDMGMLRTLVILTVKSLIAIGDAVIAVFLLFIKLFLLLLNKIKNIYRSVRRSTRKATANTVFKNNFFVSKKPKIKLSSKLNKAYRSKKASFRSFFVRTKIKAGILKSNLLSFSIPRVGIKRPRRVRKTKFFPMPVFVKVKYFIFGFLVSTLFIFLPVLFAVSIQNLPHPNQLVSQDVAQTTKIYDRNGTLLYQIYANQNRTIIPLSEIPESLRNATIAIEDKNFYKTPGFDLLAIGRSLVANARGEPLQGGSTITQQLIKTRLLTPERTLTRKAKELVLAVWAERIYSKDQILEMYLNQVPYGGTAWGVEAASQTYFGKNAKDLTLSESAFLAGLPRAPSIYSPYGENPTLWKKRQNEVLTQMASLGYISKQEAEYAKSQELTFIPQRNILHAPHFVMYVKDFLTNRYGIEVVEKGGLSVTTSLDLKTQELAQNIVEEEVEANAHLNLTNAGALVTNPKNGDIIAMVGGKDYYSEDGGNFNVTTARRQPGSTIKAVTYAAALMDGYTAASVIADSPVSYGSAETSIYRPVNYSGGFRGNVTFRTALANSINVPAVKILNQIGIPSMVGLAKRMGIKTWGEPDDYGLSITLGSAEVRMTDMAEVYGTLANGGEKVALNPVLKITNYRGDVLEEKIDTRKERVLPAGVSYIITSILSDNNARALEFGTNSVLNIPGRTIAVKTGTTDSKRDNWTIGYSPSLLTAVWVGNNNNTPMDPSLTSGITGAAPIWSKIMSEILKGSKNETFEAPGDIAQKRCFGRNEYFIRGTENTGCRSVGIQQTTITPPSP